MRPHPAFTLVELMVVVVLMAVATGIATLGLRDASETARIQSTIDQFRASVRAAHLHATSSGRPVMIECKPTGFRLRKPVWEKDSWRWHDGAWAVLDEPLRIEAVLAPAAISPMALDVPSWTALVRPGDWLSRYQLSVGYGDRVVATTVLSALGSASEVHWERR